MSLTIVDYLTSLHYGPGAVSSVVAAGMWLSGVAPLGCGVVAGAGLFISGFCFYLSPLLLIRRVGGSHEVSRAELRARPADNVPPITAFYPTNAVPPAKGIEWLPFGRDVDYLRGMASYVHVPFVALRDMRLTQLLVSAAAPPLPLMLPDGRPRPLVIFSHGLSGYPHLSSMLLTNLAARGALVLAVTHTDASAAYCRDASGDVRVKFNPKLQWVAWEREPQLEHRVRELRATLRHIQSGAPLRDLGYAADDVAAFLAARPAAVLTGHSFGGAAAIATALEEENDASLAQRLIASVVLYDPWHIPLSRHLFRDRIVAGDATYTTPTLQFHSEEWTRWPESKNFWDGMNETLRRQRFSPEARARVEEAVARRRQNRTSAPVGPDGESWLQVVPSPGTGHLTFTDMSVLSPVVYRKPYATANAIAQTVDWANRTLAFAAEQATPLSP